MNISVEELKKLDEQTVPFILKSKKEVRISMDDVRELHKGKRPDKMDYEVYKELRTQIRAAVKKQLGGELIHVSKMTDVAWINFLAESKNNYVPQKGSTYIKDKKND